MGTRPRVSRTDVSVSSSLGTTAAHAASSEDGNNETTTYPRRGGRRDEKANRIPESYVFATRHHSLTRTPSAQGDEMGEILHVEWAKPAPTTPLPRTLKEPWFHFLVSYFLLSSFAIYMIAFHEHQVEEAMKHYVQYTAFPLALFFYAVEPMFVLIQVILYTHPASTEQGEVQGLMLGANKIKPVNNISELDLTSEMQDDSTQPVGNNEDQEERGEITSLVSQSTLNTGVLQHAETAHMAIVIPCHCTPAEILVRTITSCLHYVQPYQIYVVENDHHDDGGSSCSELKDALCNANLHSVHYIYNPYANKTLALYAGCLAAKQARHILILDDDVILPSSPHMSLGTHLLNEHIRAVCYPIVPIIPLDGIHKKPSTFARALVAWQRVEYQLSDYSKLLQSFCGSAAYPHGAISLWDRTTLIQCCREHDTVFYADDLKMGWWLQKQGYRLLMLPASVVETAAPTCLWSNSRRSTSLWRQRVCSWDMAEHVYHGECFTMIWESQHECATGWVLRAYQIWACFTLFSDWIRLPVTLLTVAWNAQAFGLWMFVVSMGYTAVLLIWNDMAYRRIHKRRCSILAIVTFPIYKLYTLFLRIMGMMRAFVWYLPRFTLPPSIPVLEEITYSTGDRRPVWLDPKYSKYFEGYNPDQPEAVWK